jgi:hypothetical protein
MEDAEARLCKLFEDKLTMTARKLFGTKCIDQATRVDQVQEKVDLSMSFLGDAQQEQLHVAHDLKEFPASRVGPLDHHGPQLTGSHPQFPPLPPPQFHTMQVNFSTSS